MKYLSDKIVKIKAKWYTGMNVYLKIEDPVLKS